MPKVRTIILRSEKGYEERIDLFKHDDGHVTATLTSPDRRIPITPEFLDSCSAEKEECLRTAIMALDLF